MRLVFLILSSLILSQCKFEKTSQTDPEAQLCPEFDQSVTKFGKADADIVKELGAPIGIIDLTKDNKPTTTGLFEFGGTLSLNFGFNDSSETGKLIYDVTSYTFNKDKKVIGYTNSISNHVEQLKTIEQMFPWAKQIPWDYIQDEGNDKSYAPPLQMVTLYKACNQFQISIFARCYDIEYVDSKTYLRAYRDAIAPFECRYQRIIIFDKNNVERTKVPYKPLKI